MAILILYESAEGQTRRIASFVAETARQDGHDPTVIDVSDPTVTVSYDGIAHVVLAAPVHERRHPKTFEAFLVADRDKLEGCHTLLLSVSLSAAYPEGREEAQDYVTEMKMRTGFTPDEEMLVPGAIRTGEYDYFATQIVRHVVLRGRDYPADKDVHEFTDWDELARRVSAFLSG